MQRAGMLCAYTSAAAAWPSNAGELECCKEKRTVSQHVHQVRGGLCPASDDIAELECRPTDCYAL